MLYVKTFENEAEKASYAGPKKYVSFTKENSKSAMKTPDYSQEYLTFKILTDGTIAYHLEEEEGLALIPVSYSLDNGETWSDPSDSISINVQPGDIILWKGEYEYTESEIQYAYFFGESTAALNIEGNIMSLLYGDNFIGQTSLKNIPYVFTGIFEYTNIINAKNLVLPAVSLTEYCYCVMFDSCTLLKSSPKLPATVLAEACYMSMFGGCTSLL